MVVKDTSVSKKNVAVPGVATTGLFFRRRVLGVALHLAVLPFTVLACFGPPLLSPVQPPDPARDVVLVDQAGLDRLRERGHVISAPRGEVTARAPCLSGSVDQQCVEAAHQRLREAAAQRGANVVLLVKAATLQSHPPQYAVTGVLYEVTPRP